MWGTCMLQKGSSDEENEQSLQAADGDDEDEGFQVSNSWFSPDVIRVSIFGHPPSWCPWPAKFMLSRRPILQSCLVFCAINRFGNGPIRRKSL